MLSALNVQAEAWTGNLNFVLGQKTLEEEDWAPLDKQTEFGVLIDFKQTSWPVSIAVDILASVDTTTDLGIEVEGNTSEFDIGVRKIWDMPGSQIKPYIGGGLAFINAEIKATDVVTVSIDDSGTGYWLNGGIYWALTENFNLGIDLRYSQADVTFFGIEGDAGGTHVGVLAGYHW